MKGKQITVGGLIVEQSSLLKNFIQMKVLRLLINGFRDLPIVLKFHFIEKRIVIQLRSSIQGCYVFEDVEQTWWKTSQTWIRYHCPFWWWMEKHADKGSSEVWCATRSSGLDKRQCSVQLTIFADGKPRVKHLIIFEAKGAICMGSTYASSVLKKRLGVMNE